MNRGFMIAAGVALLSGCLSQAQRATVKDSPGARVEQTARGSQDVNVKVDVNVRGPEVKAAESSGKEFLEILCNEKNVADPIQISSNASLSFVFHNISEKTVDGLMARLIFPKQLAVSVDAQWLKSETDANMSVQYTMEHPNIFPKSLHPDMRLQSSDIRLSVPVGIHNIGAQLQVFARDRMPIIKNLILSVLP